MPQTSTTYKAEPFVPVNEQLMRAGNLRQAKKDTLESEQADPALSARLASPTHTYRQKIAQERQEKDRIKALLKRKKALSIATNPIKVSTGKLLVFAWTNLIDSFGLTFLYIIGHYILSFVFPDLFCKLGEEWTIAGQSVGGGMLTVIETIVFYSVTILVVMLIAGALVIFIPIIAFMSGSLTDKASMLWEFGSELWELL